VPVSTSLIKSYLVDEANGGGFKWVLLRQMHPNFPDSALVRGPFGPEKFHDKFVEPTENGYFVLRLDQLDDIRVHATFTRRRRRHLDKFDGESEDLKTWIKTSFSAALFTHAPQGTVTTTTPCWLQCSTLGKT
jgi:hypothetical protein